jgi:putative flippase GtrA
MMTFTKAQMVSLLASLIDFLVTFFLVQMAGAGYLIGGACGTISGGITSFFMNRNWVFNAGEKKWTPQLVKFILVWAGNFVLNISGLFLLVHYGEMNYLVAKISTAVITGVFYNYIMQKRFVFK